MHRRTMLHVISNLTCQLNTQRPRCSSLGAINAVRNLSKKSIDRVDPRALSHVESLGMGIRKRKKGRQKRLNEPLQARYDVPPPPPFATRSKPNDNKNDNRKYRVTDKTVKVLSVAGSTMDRFPKSTAGLPEVALIGRSNVGKSTLLNALVYGAELKDRLKIKKEGSQRRTNNNNVPLPRGIKATTSDRPGETKQITWYQITSKMVDKQQNNYRCALMIVDLPGYGFAFATSPEKASEWQHDLVQHYFLQRGKELKRILLLVDARHGIKKADADFWSKLESDYYLSSQEPKQLTLPPIQIVLTKCDLVSQEQLAARMVSVKEQFLDCLQREPKGMLPVALTSSRDAGFTSGCKSSGRTKSKSPSFGGGIVELQRQLASLCPPTKRAAVDAGTGTGSRKKD